MMNHRLSALITIKLMTYKIIDDLTTATKPQFRAISGLGDNKIRDLITNGIVIDGEVLKLETISAGSRVLILLSSWRRIIERQRQHPITLTMRGAK